KSRERTMPESGPVISVSAPQPAIQKSAMHELLRKTGASVSPRRLEDQLNGLTAATGLTTGFYGWHSAAGISGHHVEIEARRNSQTQLMPSFFFQLSTDEPSRPTFRLSSATILKDAYKSRFLTDLYLGDNPAVFLEYYLPFNGSPWFVTPGSSLER